MAASDTPYIYTVGVGACVLWGTGCRTVVLDRGFVLDVDTVISWIPDFKDAVKNKFPKGILQGIAFRVNEQEYPSISLQIDK